MPNYLDDLPTYSARATLVIADLGILAAEILSGQGDATTEIDKINRYTTWLTGANDTAQSDDLRLRLLTLLVDNARLDEVPTPNVFQVTLIFGNTTVAATQWGLITGNINDQLDLIAKFNTYLPLAGGTMTGNISFGTDGLGIDTLNEGDTLNIGASAGVVQFGLDGEVRLNVITQGAWAATNIGVGYGGLGNLDFASGVDGQAIIKSGAGYAFYTIPAIPSLTGYIKADGTVPMTADLRFPISKGIDTAAAGTLFIGQNNATAVQIFKDLYLTNVLAGTWLADIIGLEFGGTGANLPPPANDSFFFYSTIDGSSAFVTFDSNFAYNNTTKTLGLFSALTGIDWNGNVIGVAYGGTGLSSVGAEGSVLTVVSGVPAWAAFTALTNPMTTAGDTIYGGVAGIPTRLAANATSTNKFLRSVSSGNPSWQLLVAGDIPTILQSQVFGLTTALTNKLGTGLTDGKIFVGNAANAAAQVMVSGDATMTNAGVLTISNTAVTFAKMQNITYRTLMGRWSAGDGDPQEIVIGSGLNLDAFGVLTSSGTGASDKFYTVSATVPDATFDNTQGYVVGSQIYCTLNEIYYRAGNVGTGVAVWNIVGIIDYFNQIAAFGYDSGVGNTGVNVALFGINSGLNNTGNNVTSIGDTSGTNNTGSSVTFLGYFSGINNTGTNVTALGINAGTDNTADDLVAVGPNAGRSNIRGNVTAIGYSAGYNNIQGNIVLLGQSAQATNDNQFSVRVDTNKQAIFDFLNITADREYLLPNASGTLALLSDITTGVTFVGMTVPSALSVTPASITTSGTFAITGAGTVAQYIRGDGTLANFPTAGGGGSSVSYYLNGSITQFGTYKQMSRVPVNGLGTNFTLNNTTGYQLMAQFVTDANDPALLNIPAGAWDISFYFSSSNNTGNPAFYVELLKYDGSTFTSVATSIASPEIISNGTAIDLYNTSLAVSSTSLTVTDRLAIRVYVDTAGSRTITFHTEDAHLAQIITTFSTGLTALNGLTAQVQFFGAIGTTGTAPAWTSSTATHTLNIPLASATSVTAGLISKTDYDSFAGKQSALSGTGYSKWSGSTPSYLTPTQVTADLNLFSSSLQGLAPASGGGTANFLRADGTWAAPGGSGTVNSGTQYQLAYYAANGTAVSGLTLITALRALVSDANGLPVASSTSTTQLQYLSSATGTTGTTSTNLVFSTSPTLVTPTLGAATATSINGLTISTTTGTLSLANSSTFATSGAFNTTLTATGTTALTLPTTGTLATLSNNLGDFAATTSAQLAGVISDETGSGSLVFATSPTLTTPVIGAATGTSLTTTGALTSGVTSSAAGTLVLRNATNAFTQTIRGTNPAASIVYDLPTTAPTAGQSLVSTAPSGGVATLSWTTVTGSGVTTMTAIGAVPNANGASISGVNLTLQPADATNGGVVIFGTQTFGGAKTFNNTTTFSLAGATGNAIDLTGIGSKTNAAIRLSGGTLRWIDFGNAGNSIPVIGASSRSDGTKIVLANTQSASLVDFGFGMSATALWSSVGNNTTSFSFEWYGGATLAMQLRGDGLLTLVGDLTIPSAKNIILNATTGTKIATATTQKLAFWNKTPVVQPTTAITASAFVSNTSLIANDTATFGGYTIGQLAAALIQVGILA